MKEELYETAQFEGKVRGVVLSADAEYIRRHEGEEALPAVEEETKRMGYPINYSEIKAMSWYPAGLRIVSLLAVRKALNWDDGQIREMARCAPKYSLITKLMLRYFARPQTLVPRLGSYWRKNFTIGSLEGRLTDDHSAILDLRHFTAHPLVCTYLQGYFLGTLGMVVGQTGKLSVEETKCTHRGDAYHEFVLQW